MTSYRRSLRFSMFSAGIFFAGVGMGGFLWPPSLGVSLLIRLVSNIEEVLGNSDDVLQVKKPPQHHFDRQCRHTQKKERHHMKPDRSERLVEPLEPLFRKNRWNYQEISQNNNESEYLANERILG